MRCFILAVCVPFGLSGAQAPTVDSTAVAARADRLPVLDLDGGVISEAEIRHRMRPPDEWQIIGKVVGIGLAGALLFSALADPGHECVPRDPCSPREIWMREAGLVFGLAAGMLVGAALPNGGIDRERAIEIIRQRRAAWKAERR